MTKTLIVGPSGYTIESEQTFDATVSAIVQAHPADLLIGKDANAWDRCIAFRADRVVAVIEE